MATKKQTKKGSSKSSKKPTKKTIRDFFFSTWVIVVLLWLGLILVGRSMLDMSAGEGSKKVSIDKEKSRVVASIKGLEEKEAKNFKSINNEVRVSYKKARKEHLESKKHVESKKVVVATPKCGRISLIIDDMGRDIKMARKLLELPFPIAFAVLPYEPHTAEVVDMIKKKGRVLLLHMPMEPKGYPQYDPGPGALFLNQSEEEQKRLFLKALSRVPGAVGVNNHMGSRFTENRKAMTRFLSWVKEKGLFFVDSMTTPKSVGCDVARELGVPCMKRDVFLDHLVKRDFIAHQIVELGTLAKRKCYVLAIGHPHSLTFQFLSSTAFDKQYGLALVSLRVK